VSSEVWGQVGGLSITEQKTQFSVWCMLAAPIILANDPRSISTATLRILLNTEMLQISQDALGRQATRVWTGEKLSIWRKDLADGQVAVMLLNGGDRAADIIVRFNDHLPDLARTWWRNVPRQPECKNEHGRDECNGWAHEGECEKNPSFMRKVCAAACDVCPPAQWEGKQATALVRDVWEREYVGIFTAQYTARRVEPHGACVVLLRWEEPGFAQQRTLQALIERERLTQRRERAAATSNAEEGEGDASRLLAEEMIAEPTLGACAERHGWGVLIALFLLCKIALFVTVVLPRLKHSLVGRRGGLPTVRQALKSNILGTAKEV